MKRIYKKYVPQVEETNIVARVCMTDGHGESGTLCRGVISGTDLSLEKLIWKNQQWFVTVPQCQVFLLPRSSACPRSTLRSVATCHERYISFVRSRRKHAQGLVELDLVPVMQVLHPSPQNELMPLFLCTSEEVFKDSNN